MDTLANIGTTIDRPLRHRASFARRVLLISAAVGLIVIAASTVRLVAITWAVPTELWVDEYPPLVDAAVKVNPRTQSWARLLTEITADPALFHALGTVCFPGSAAEGSSETIDKHDDQTACMAEIDAALRAAPTSGELWYFKASTLASEGDFGAAMMDALRNSYLTAPAEGWIVSERVVMGLELFPALAPDLQQGARSDLALVVRETRLAQPLVNAYVGDSLLRAAAVGPLNALPADALQRFVGLVRAALPRR